MNKHTYQFHEPGSIPGVPGEFHAGMEVDVDTDTMTILDQRLMHASETPSDEQPTQQLASIDEAKTSKAKGAKS